MSFHHSASWAVRWRTADAGGLELVFHPAGFQLRKCLVLISTNKLEDDQRIIASLAEGSTLAIDEVAQLYRHERAALEARSHIKTFCSVFAIRHVRELLRRRAPRQPTVADG